jgi:FG-GAP-like repeat
MRRLSSQLFVLLGAALPAVLLAGSRPLALHRQVLDLPGAPALVVATDWNDDGRLDLAVVVAYTERGAISFEESSRMEGIDSLVEVLTVVPALVERRELFAFLADGSGGYRAASAPLALPPSVLSLEAGPQAQPVIALTDEGVGVVRWSPSDGLTLEPWIREPPALAGAGAFVPNLGLLRDLDGDSVQDLLLPTAHGLSIYRTREGRLEQQPIARLTLPFDGRLAGGPPRTGGSMTRLYSLPEVADVDADGLPDLLVRDRRARWNAFQLWRGAGEGRFHAPLLPLADRLHETKPAVVFVGDLDGDHRAELVTEEQPNADVEGGLRAELREAKRPHFVYRLHRLGQNLRMEPVAARQFETEGYAFGGDDSGPSIPGGFQDLNGDGRLDLVAVTLDFSVLQAVKIMAVKRITIGLDFRLWCQSGDGSFRPVEGLDLSGEFKLDLNNLRLGQLALFAGDFDGDGNADFVQMGRGRMVTVHRGRDDCSYPAKADLSIQLEEPPQDLALVHVRDLDGDGRADLLLIRALPITDGEVTAPARLELYLSQGD